MSTLPTARLFTEPISKVLGALRLRQHSVVAPSTKVLVALCLSLSVAILSGCSSPGTGQTSLTETGPNTGVAVADGGRVETFTLLATGSSATAGVTWVQSPGADGRLGQEVVRLPWSTTVTIDPAWVALSVGNDDGGQVTCTIKQGARVVSTQTADGDELTAECTLGR